ncbi:MAG: radical SAM protein, partial [Flavobacteriaceae bacterium]
MSGLYLHIPFCKKACHYCNFHFSTSMRYADDMVAAIQQEIRLRKQDAIIPIETIYFGGGTPSVLSPAQLQLLIDEVNQCYDLVKNPEITLEANPDDLSKAYMRDI